MDMQSPRVIRAYKLEPGDRFSFIPAEWCGPGIVRESYGHRAVKPRPLGLGI